VSPSVWFANKQILRDVEAVPNKPHLRIWVDTGTKEGTTAEEAQQTVANARLLKDALVRKGWRPGRDLSYFEAVGAEHNERAWAARMELILKFLFPRWQRNIVRQVNF
jgi:predicted alpha/beta superfamily hydrolase